MRQARVERVLLVEDSPEYAQLVTEMLYEAFTPELHVEHHTTLAPARAALPETRADCVMVDLTLPDCRGLDVLRAVRNARADLPVLILSGHEDEDLAVQAVHEGAQDYIVKRQAESGTLGRAIRYAIERKQAELKLSHLALHDPLTGLANRTLFGTKLASALARTERIDAGLAVLFIDLDRFKIVNDSLGHDVGDKLLAEVAHRLGTLLRPSDTLARFGGDEFVVLCEDVERPEHVIAVADRLSEAVREPFEVAGNEVFVGMSIGIALGSGPDVDGDTLIRDADQTMYRAKQAGTLYELFEPRMHAETLQALRTANELHRAIERDELRLEYQPLVDLPTRRVFAVEALLRWEHPSRGVLGPDAFLGIAELTGLMGKIGRWVVSTACRQLSAWRSPDLMMAVNLSPRELEEAGLLEGVAEAIRASGIRADQLCLEVTETEMGSNPDRLRGVLRDLKELGVTLALDDFGTGYSSLSALRDYPLDIVKLDRSLIEAVEDGGRSDIFSAALAIPGALNMRSVAEGVEDREQLEMLVELGCDAAQGFYLALPVAPEHIPPLLEQPA